jgi:hypothetical protein
LLNQTTIGSIQYAWEGVRSETKTLKLNMTLHLKFNGGFDGAITQLFLNNSMLISSTNIKDKLACKITKRKHTQNA